MDFIAYSLEFSLSVTHRSPLTSHQRSSSKMMESKQNETLTRLGRI